MKSGTAGCVTSLVFTLACFVGREAPAPGHPDPVPRVGPLEPDCLVCHPGARRALELTAHGVLLRDETTKDRACILCHGEAKEHVFSARRPELQLVPAGPVDKDRCSTCHSGQDYQTSLAAHPWRSREAVEQARLQDRPPIPPPDLPEPSGLANFQWSGLVQLGWRFVSRSGSADRYDTDVNLGAGLRLNEARWTGDGRSDWLDRMDLRARDLGDPWRRVSAEFSKEKLYRASFEAEEKLFVYRARGDYARVSREEQNRAASIDLDLSEDLTFTTSFDRAEDDGRWLVRRLAGRGSTPPLPVVDVDSPRSLVSETFSVGLHGRHEGLTFRAGIDLLDQFAEERFSFDREAPSNPLLRESETFASRSTLRGPSVHAGLGHDFDGVRVDLGLRHRWLQRRIIGTGTATGAEPVEFQTSTRAFAAGSATSTHLDLTIEAELSESVVVLLDLNGSDHRESLRLDQEDVTIFPGTGGGTTVRENLDQRTRQQRAVGALTLDWRFLPEVTATVGWGFSNELLRLPELAGGSIDPTRGRIRDDGVILGLDYRFAKDWTLALQHEAFGQTGLLLSEQQQRDARFYQARLRRRGEDLSGELSFRSRRAKNDASAYRLEADTVAIHGNWRPEEGVTLFSGYTYTRSDSSTLTSFYFDPDPDPVPTVVGFRGETHTLAAGLDLEIGRRATLQNGLAWTRTTGSFRVRTVDLHADLRVKLSEQGAFGIRYQHLGLAERGGSDDYHADLLMVYWRQEFGGVR